MAGLVVAGRSRVAAEAASQAVADHDLDAAISGSVEVRQAIKMRAGSGVGYGSLGERTAVQIELQEVPLGSSSGAAASQVAAYQVDEDDAYRAMEEQDGEPTSRTARSDSPTPNESEADCAFKKTIGGIYLLIATLIIAFVVFGKSEGS
jgi:hypothetical protein